MPPSPALRIRTAGPGDLNALIVLLAQLADGQVGPGPAAGEPAAAVLAGILTAPGRHLLVAEVASGPSVAPGTLLGTVDLLIVANLTHGGAPFALLENVVVHAQARHRGVGRALLARATELAHEAGCYKIQLLSRNTRTEAHAFYRSVGFEPSAQGFRRYLSPA